MKGVLPIALLIMITSCKTGTTCDCRTGKTITEHDITPTSASPAIQQCTSMQLQLKADTCTVDYHKDNFH